MALPAKRPQRIAGPVLDHHAVGDAEVVEAVEDEARVAVKCGVGQPFQMDGHRQHGPAVENVRLQNRMRGDIDGALEREDEVRRGIRGGRSLGQRRGGDATRSRGGHGAGRMLRRAEGDHFHRAARGVQLVDQERGAFRQRDQADAFGFEHLPQGRRDHATFPRAPVDADDPRVGPLAGLHLGDLVQDFVGGRVGGLAGAAEAACGAAEEHDRFQIFAAEKIEQVAGAVHLGVENVVELVRGEVFEAAVGEHASTVNEAGDRPELHFHLMQQIGDGSAPGRHSPRSKRPSRRRLRCGQSSP